MIPLFLSLLLSLFTSCDSNVKENNLKETAGDKTAIIEDRSERMKDIPDGLRKLVKAYPDFLDSADDNNLYWKDGTVMIYDDGKQKSFDELLDNADLEDQMSQEYVKGADWENPPPVNFEPGRIRNEEFFRKMYGNSAGEVQSTLTNVQWLPNSENTSIIFTTVNGADEQLYKVSQELDNLSNELLKYVKNNAGSFNWRVIAKTNRLSMHSFAIAVDINTQYSNYWQWEKGLKYKNQIPMEIVEVFEKHGFIWGGKWYHFDTMHFEYRPELIVD